MRRPSGGRSVTTMDHVQPGRPGASGLPASPWRVPGVSAAIAAAWVLAVGAQLTGEAVLLHHHALIEGGAPLWIALALFLLGWQVMIAAMMLPASLPSIGAFNAAAQRARRRHGLAAFLSAYVLAWSIFGLLAFMGDDVLHHIVDAVPWLADRPWLIEASVLALAGVYQFSPLKRRGLAACRHPAALAQSSEVAGRSSLRLGLDHGLACLGSSWALMLLMFAEGFANLSWMAALAAVMVYEATGRHGPRAAKAVGVGLLFAALATVSGGGLAR
jgi:predicted metal-binding membrane protein